MNQPTERGVREATEWVDKEIARARLVSRDEFLDDRFIPAPILRTIRTALEKMNRDGEPKAVTYDWVRDLEAVMIKDHNTTSHHHIMMVLDKLGIPVK